MGVWEMSCAPRPAAVGRGDPGQPQHRERQQDDQHDDPHDRADLDQVCLGPPDERPQGLEAVPELARVPDRVKRPVERLEDLVVDDLEGDHERERHPDGHCQDAPASGGQGDGERDQHEALEREPQERVEREVLRLVRSDEDGPHDRYREDREHGGDHRSYASGHAPGLRLLGWGAGRGIRGGRDLGLARDAVSPQPEHVAAEGLE